MEVRHRVEQQICIFYLEGNLIVGNETEMDMHFAPAFNNPSISSVVLNLQKVNFIDSSGIGLIMYLYKKLTKNKFKLVLCELSKKVHEVLSMVQLDKLLSITLTEEEAINKLKI